jgi:hypothetical protein
VIRAYVLSDRILLCLSGCKERKGTPVGQMLEDASSTNESDKKVLLTVEVPSHELFGMKNSIFCIS